MSSTKANLKVTKAALDAGKFEEAAKEARKILDVDPNNYHASVRFRHVFQNDWLRSLSAMCSWALPWRNRRNMKKRRKYTILLPRLNRTILWHGEVWSPSMRSRLAGRSTSTMLLPSAWPKSTWRRTYYLTATTRRDARTDILSPQG